MRHRLMTFTGTALIIFVVLGTLEVAAFVYTTYLAQRYGIIFYLPRLISEDFASYSARVHPVLGWPSPQAKQEQPDGRADSKQLPGEIRLSAYGDSFTAGFGVEPEHTWSAVLGNMLGCQIENYGVPGYGTDQSYLRFHHNRSDPADIVFFGHLSENIQRNVNQLRNFLAPIHQCQTKPRFILDEKGQLQLVPLPQLSAENYDVFIKNPERFLRHDYFAPGGPSGAQKLGFPYLWSVVKAYRFFYNYFIVGYKSYLQFYRPDHPSRAFPLTMAIINQFHQEAQSRGNHPIVLIFPTDEDFRYYNKHLEFVYKPLIRELEKSHLDYIDLGSEIVTRWGDKNYMDLFSGEKYYHFNKEGNKLIAQIIYDYFSARNYCPRTPKANASNLEDTRAVKPEPAAFSKP
jgi:hypothetical protein